MQTEYSPKPIQSFEDLIQIFHDAEKPADQWRVGTESEKFAVTKSHLQPPPFEGNENDGQPSIEDILNLFCEKFSWQKKSEYPGGKTIYLLKENASITLEPAGQVELSGAPLRTIHETCQETKIHIKELQHIGQQLGIAWLPIGFHPLAKLEDLPWMPKLRYGVMKQYLPTRSETALDMMQRTCTVQANFDYANETDAIEKLQIALKIQPIVSAMFANSPWIEGKRSAYLSQRSHVWINMDPDRSGLLPFAWQSNMSYQKYTEWALDVPMFLIQRGHKIIHNTGQTFREFMANGFEGETPNQQDWETHLNTLFPEVRIKKTIEVRGTDSQNAELTCASSAFWKGILYDQTALDKVKTLTENFKATALEEARPTIAKEGLHATLFKKPVFEWAEEILNISKDGLKKQNALNKNGKDESIFLQPLEHLISQKLCPAEILINAVGNNPTPNLIVEKSKI